MATVSVRYIVDDVDAAIAFYTGQLEFTEVVHPVEDRSGNPIELFEPTIPEARLDV